MLRKQYYKEYFVGTLFVRLAILALVFLLPTSVLAVDPLPTGPAYFVFDFAHNRTGSGNTMSVNESSGGFNYSVDIQIPHGRNSIEPNLSLSYDSSNISNSTLVGYGWSISIPYIERINKTGVESLYDQDYFYSSLSGELASTTGNLYEAKVENGNFLRYELNDNIWKVVDKQGMVYTFGESSSTAQYDLDNTNHIFKWFLEKTTDPNGNTISYQYTKDANQLYPSSINYAGHNETDGIYGVAFFTELRNDTTTSTASGFSVVTKKRISEIQVQMNGSWMRKYELEYTHGDNGVRSLLSNITESGKDESGNTITLPSTDLTYQSNDPGWVEDILFNTSTIPIEFFYEEDEDMDRGVRVFDVDGDGLDDIVQSTSINRGDGFPNEFTRVWINQGDGVGWLEDHNYDIPVAFNDTFGGAPHEWGVRIADINGDGLLDLLQSYRDNGGGQRKAFINDGDGTGWTYDSSYGVPGDFYDLNVGDKGLRLGDVNGDGLVDVVESYNNEGNVTRVIYLNKGEGIGIEEDFSISTSSLPIFFEKNSYLQDQGTRFADVNGDGLDDIIQSKSVFSTNPNVVEKVFINQGNADGWEAENDYSIPKSFYDASGSYAVDYGVRVFDANGDGLPDLIKNDSVSNGISYLNKGNGTGWDDGTNFPAPLPFLNPNIGDFGTRVLDINGDRLPDLIRSYDGTSQGDFKIVYRNSGDHPDMLSNISKQSGGTIKVEYKSSAEYRDGNNDLYNPDLLLKLLTVDKLVYNDLFGTIATTTYSYADGSYYFNNSFDKKFAGFGFVTKTDPDGNVTKTYYHQGNNSTSTIGEYNDHVAKIGKPFRVERYDDSDNLFSKTINTWENVDLGNNRDFVKLTQTINSNYDGDTDHRDSAETYSYDNANGNQTYKKEWGEVTGSDNSTFSDVTGDSFSTVTSYISTSTIFLAGLPKQETVYDNSSSTIVMDTKLYYDTLSFGSATKGNETKHELLKSGSTYIDTEKSYNSYGLVTQEKDPLNNATDYVYDYENLYPRTVTNPLNQTTTLFYDYSSGKVASSTDPNGLTYQTVYDALDRIKTEKIPDLTTPSTLVDKTTFTYTDTKGAKSIKKSDYLDASNIVDTYTYFDGLDRPIQTRRESEDANTFTTADTIYNTRGLVHKKSLPYFSSGSTRTTATTTTDLLTMYTYDPLKRVSQEVNAAGNTTYLFDQWKTTITDAESNVKHLYQDAYKNLIKVDEVNNTSTYTTLYEYNYNKNLTKVTDALSNIRNFTYDGLGRRLTAEDLHASGDTYFGTWTYTYDDAGNISSRLSPENETINYTYDDINRVLTEDYTGQGGTEISYAYDTSCLYGIGKLCTATSTDAIVRYDYNPLGLVATETKIINGDTFITEYEYHRQGNTITITLPDNAEISYTYNNGGQVETVAYQENGGNLVYVVEDIDYGPHGEITYQKNFNATETINTYDADELYRLSNRLTTTTAEYEIALFNPGSEFFNRLFTALENEQLLDEPLDEIIEQIDQEIVSDDAIVEENVDMPSQDALADDISEDTSIEEVPLEETEDQILEGETNDVEIAPDETVSEQDTVEVLPNDIVENEQILEQDTTIIASPEISNPLVLIENSEVASTTIPLVTSVPPRGANIDHALVMDSIKYTPYRCLEKDIVPPGVKATMRGAFEVLPLSEVPEELCKIKDTAEEVLFFYRGAKVTKQKNEIARGENFVTVKNNDGSFTTEISSSKSYLNDQGTWYELKTATTTKELFDTVSKPFTIALYNIAAQSTTATTFSGDGYVRNGVLYNWPSSHDAALGDNSNTTYQTTRVHNTYFWATGLVYRSAFPFDTSIIPSNAVIKGAEFTVKVPKINAGLHKGDGRGVDLVATTQGSHTALTTSDYNEFSATSTPTIIDSNLITTTGKYTFTFASTSFPIIKKEGETSACSTTTGITCLGLRGDNDSKNRPPNNASDVHDAYYSTSESTNPANRPVLQVTYTIPYEASQDLTYTYDNVGNIIEIVDASANDSAKTITYTYDDLYRLTQASTTNALINEFLSSYAYNVLGNITSKSDQGSYLYEGNNGTNYANPHAVTDIAETDYTYDKNGNLLTDTTATYDWDYNNNLVSADNGSAISTYRYDHTGQRVTMGVGTSTPTIYPNKYYNKEDSKITKHIFLPDGTLIATVEDDGATISTSIIHTDHLGGTHVVSDEYGNQIELNDYYPFGEIRIDEGYTDEQRKFTGHEYDGETNLHYAGARYYDQDIGRWLSQDLASRDNPERFLADPQQLNTYSYTKNNPVKLVDRNGLSSFPFQSVKNAVSSIYATVKNFFNSSSKSSSQQRQPSYQITSGDVKLGPLNNHTWDPVTDQRISELNPVVQMPATSFINNVQLQEDVQLRVTEGYRSTERQDELYAQGRTTPGPIVTYAPGGYSYHNQGLAIDVSIINKDGQTNYAISPDIAQYGKDEGFKWGGDWQSFRDTPHFEMRKDEQ